MKNIYLHSIFIFISIQTNVYAQNIKSKDNYNVPIRAEEGDLNNDGRMDKVTVEMDTINETKPLRLQIFLSQRNGKSNLIVSSTKIIEAMYPLEKNGNYNGYQIPDFSIEYGNLIMVYEIKGGHSTHEFKYQHGNFELIKVSKVTNDATIFTDEKTIFTETEFNLITGLRIEIDQLLGSDKILNKRIKTVLIRPLPKIQDFKFYDKELY